jgi:hypothetical protein
VARVFALDVLRCSSCGGRRQILAAITEAWVIGAILAALDLPTDGPALPPARGSPELFDGARVLRAVSCRSRCFRLLRR